jgi:glycosyl transferase family 25
MHIYVINLARATERRQKMQAQADALGIHLDFIEAVDGKTITDADRALVDHEKRRRITPYPLTDNEIGCWLSHRRAMQRLIESGDRMATILEDDAALAPDFPRVLEVVEARGAPFDVVDLHRNLKKHEIFAVCRPLLPGFSLGRIGYTHMNATGYVMSHEGAQKFLAYAKRFVHAVDKEMHSYWANGLDVYGIETPVVLPDDGGYSFIGETRGAGAGDDRPRYEDSERLYWRLQRRLTRLADSVQKRLLFPAYVLRGRHPRRCATG